MEQLINFIPLHSKLPIYIAIDIAIAIVLLFAIRWLSGVLNKVDVNHELGERDNFAFGVSIAGRMIALTIVLSAVVGRHVGLGYQEAALSMLTFGTLGIILVRLGRFAHDKLVLHELDKDEMISERNISVGLVDAASAISSAIITKSIIHWADGNDAQAFVAIITGAIVVLAVLLLATRLYEYRFAEKNQNVSFQRTLSKGQIALAIQHSGNLIGIAIAVSATSKIIAYEPYAYVTNVTGWLMVGVCLALILMVITSICKRIVLAGVKWRTEVALQHNIGIASIEAVLAIGIALLFSNIFVYG